MSFVNFPVLFGDYVLLDRIAAGGMAEVYRAKMTGVEGFQKLVAVKCILPAYTSRREFAEMFVDEAKLAAELVHPNIIQIQQLGRIADQLYIAMELVHGRDLRHLMQRAREPKRPLPVEFAAYVASQAALGLDYAHHKADMSGRPLNLIHRDVSPQNLLVGYEGRVKVVDFGIARADVREHKTNIGILKGKIAYMAPEQVQDGPLDRRTDLFALGLVLHEMLAGRPVFEGSDQFQTIERIRHAKVPDVRDFRPDVPDELAEIVARALAADPDARFSTGAMMAEALTSLLIRGRTIFSSKHAQEVMGELYPDEIAELPGRLQRYAQVDTAHCIRRIAATGELYSQKAADSWLDDSDSRRDPTTNLFDAAESESTRPGAADEPDPGQTLMTAAPSLDVPSKTSSPSQPASSRLQKLAAALALLTAALLTATIYVLVDGSPPADGGEGAVAGPSEAPQPVEIQETKDGTPGATQSATVSPEPVELSNGSSLDASDSKRRDPGAVIAPVIPASKQPPPARSSTPPPRKSKGEYGYISIRASGVPAAKVAVDGTPLGYSPVIQHRLRTGKHTLTVVEDNNGAEGRRRQIDVIVKRSSRSTAQKFIVEF